MINTKPFNNFIPIQRLSRTFENYYMATGMGGFYDTRENVRSKILNLKFVSQHSISINNELLSDPFSKEQLCIFFVSYKLN